MYLFSDYFSVVCFFKQKTAYEMRISDWSSDVCSSDLAAVALGVGSLESAPRNRVGSQACTPESGGPGPLDRSTCTCLAVPDPQRRGRRRSEEHTSELQSLMRISYAVFCLNKKTLLYNNHTP